MEGTRMLLAANCAYHRLGALALAILLLFAASCGDGTTSVPPSSAVQVKVGDAASDRVIAFELTLESLVLTDSNGQTVAALPQPRRVEFTRLAGTLEPVALLNLTQGSYTEASLTGSDLHLTYIDASGSVREYTHAGDISSHLVFDTLLTVTSSSVLSVDLNLAASLLSLDPTNVAPPQFEPVYTFSVSAVPETQQKEENGALEHVVGVVTAADTGSFTMQLGQNGISLTFLVDASTAFQDVTLTTLPNMIVEVDGVTAADGSLYAERVAGLASSSGAVVEGMLTAAPTGDFYTLTALSTPAGSLAVQDGVGNGMANAMVGRPLTVDFTTASYGVNGEGMPDGWAFNLIGGLLFNSSYITAGQAVQIVSDSGITPLTGGYTMPARAVILQEQAASGAVSNYRGDFAFDFLPASNTKNASKTVTARSAVSMPTAAFDLLLPEDSYLRLLSSYTTVSVGIFPETKVYGTSSISNGMNVRVRGWVFCQDELLMVADRVDFISAPVLTGARTSAPRR